MSLSTLDLFKIGIGPSSSHTVGPMRAAVRFAEGLRRDALLEATASIKVELYGSLGATGKGHGSDKAVLLGLEGESPEKVEIAAIPARLATIRERGELRLLGIKPIRFVEQDHLALIRKPLPYHPNGMIFRALDVFGMQLRSREYYSVGGGFVVDEQAAGADRIVEDRTPLPYPFHSAKELLALCAEHELRISQLMLANEGAWREEADTRRALLEIWQVMQDCVAAGCRHEGMLPGGLKVRRRAAETVPATERKPRSEPARPPQRARLGQPVCPGGQRGKRQRRPGGDRADQRRGRHHSGGAALLPALRSGRQRGRRRALPAHGRGHRHPLQAERVDLRRRSRLPGRSRRGLLDGRRRALPKCSAAASQQVENAAEIGMEHNLGLTCDPVGGLVQVPCIERNAMGAVKAINAARMALRGDGQHAVSLDKVIRTMRETGADMKTKYKETARGGLAVNVIEC